jgi:hypothetical protein
MSGTVVTIIVLERAVAIGPKEQLIKSRQTLCRGDLLECDTRARESVWMAREVMLQELEDEPRPERVDESVLRHVPWRGDRHSASQGRLRALLVEVFETESGSEREANEEQLPRRLFLLISATASSGTQTSPGVGGGLVV